ncbi:helix-turn-helix transcriptional regulator [Rhodococcus sp. 077-4]|uniref:helix-turn-helix transcriptional regulator n=1 Tax=Rhodococcus sp. 077-4 TaxID=2789271 RepID=UPI0039F4A7A7
MSATTSRLLTLLSLLQASRDWPGSVLAERLDVSQRTVRRDVDRLRELGYTIAAAMGPDGGYRLDAGNRLPPLLFDDDQVVALAVALRSAALVDAGLDEAAQRALTTVRQVLPSRLRHRLDDLEFTPLADRSGDGPKNSVSAEVLVELSTAIRSRTAVRFHYAGGSRNASDPDPMPPRSVEPHHLVTSRGRWYLVGWSRDSHDWRVFRVDRMALRMPHGPRFDPRIVPGDDVAAFVSARFKGSAEVDRWPCRGSVVLHRPAAEVVPFAGDGVVEDIGPDRCRLEGGSWSWTALAAWLNGFDTDVDVLGPIELVHAFDRLARRNSRTAHPMRPTDARG